MYYVQTRFFLCEKQTGARMMYPPCKINPSRVARVLLSCSVSTCERVPLEFSVTCFADPSHEPRDSTRNQSKYARMITLFSFVEKAKNGEVSTRIFATDAIITMHPAVKVTCVLKHHGATGQSSRGHHCCSQMP